jgi:hypothetical protein
MKGTVHAPFVISKLSGYLDHDWQFTWTPGEGALKHTAVVGMKLGLRVARIGLVEALAVKVHVTQTGPVSLFMSVWLDIILIQFFLNIMEVRNGVLLRFFPFWARSHEAIDTLGYVAWPNIPHKCTLILTLRWSNQWIFQRDQAMQRICEENWNSE